MTKIFYILMLLLFISCYEDDSRNIQSENTSHRTSELSLYIKSIASHHAAFDDKIDESSCFSLQFPYQLYINSELASITSVQDVSNLNEDDAIEIVYPVNTNFYNYQQHQANNQSELNLIKNVCTQNFDIISNPCLDFQFPITIKEFNDLTESFETYQLNNDKELYLHIENLHDNDVYEIEYPIFLKDSVSNSIRINSNADFINAFNQFRQECD